MLITINKNGLDKAKIVKKIAKIVNNKIKKGFSNDEMEVYKRINNQILEEFK